MDKFNIFTPFYYKGHVAETPLIQQAYLGKILTNYKTNPNHSNDWYAHSSFSGFKGLPYQLDWEESIKYYKLYIDKFIQSYLGKSYSWRIDGTPWYNVYGINQNGPKHDHIGSDFSIIHYLKFNPNEHPGTTFINPNYISTTYFGLLKQIFTNKLNKENINHSLYQTTYTPVVQEGDLIIFPSHLEHKVVRSRSNTPRVIIAFNFTLE
jgi:hypothetical protein